MLFTVLALTPFGLHARPAGPLANFHPDFCQSAPADNAAAAATRTNSDEKSTPVTACNECAGCAGGAMALPASVTPWLAAARAPSLIVVIRTPVAMPLDDLAARPRGPPLPA